MNTSKFGTQSGPIPDYIDTKYRKRICAYCDIRNWAIFNVLKIKTKIKEKNTAYIKLKKRVTVETIEKIDLGKN